MIPPRNKSPNLMKLTCIDCEQTRTVQVKAGQRIPQRCFSCNAKSGRWWGKAAGQRGEIPWTRRKVAE